MSDQQRGWGSLSRLAKFWVSLGLAGGLFPFFLVPMWLWLPAIGSISGEALQHSVTRDIGGGSTYDYTCRREPSRVWICEVEDPGGSGLAVYGVKLEGRRCWEARDKGGGDTEQPLPEVAHGCVDFRDQLRSVERVVSSYLDVGAAVFRQVVPAQAAVLRS